MKNLSLNIFIYLLISYGGLPPGGVYFQNDEWRPCMLYRFSPSRCSVCLSVCPLVNFVVSVPTEVTVFVFAAILVTYGVVTLTDETC